MNWESAIIFLDGLIEKLRKRSSRVSEFWLKAIGKRLRKLKGLDPSDAAGIAAIRNDTKLLSDLEGAMRAAGQDTVRDAKALLKTAARLSADAAPVAQDLAMDEWISGLAEAAQGTLQNITHTSAVAVVSSSGIVSPGDAYVAAVDEVAAQLASGEDGLRRATRKVCEQFADAGLSVVEYESGRVEELGAATERNLKQAVHEVYQGVQRRVGQEYGADGVEISAHADCAPDHLEIQGHQFTNEEYEKVNGTLRRKIGTWNCRHVIYSIIVGVTPPTYSDEELAEMRARSQEKVEFDGKEMTRYEATQVQRRLEREIRKQKNRSVIAAAADEKEMRQDAQMKINQLTDKYKELSDAFGIPTKAERMQVSGYRPVKAKQKMLPVSEGSVQSSVSPAKSGVIVTEKDPKDIANAIVRPQNTGASTKVIFPFESEPVNFGSVTREIAEERLVNLTTPNGVTITGISNHIVERINERGLSVLGLEEAVTNPIYISDIKVDETGEKSQIFIGNHDTIVINPDTGIAITGHATGKRDVKKYGNTRSL